MSLFRGFVPIEDRYPSGLSVYRSLARQHYGNPEKYQSILERVQRHYMQELTFPSAKFHETYTHYEHRIIGNPESSTAILTNPITSFFGALTCPDVPLCPCRPLEVRQAVLQVIANALQACIRVWNDGMDVPDLESGKPYVPKYHLRFRWDEKIEAPCKHTIDTLREDESGSCLIEFMKERKANRREVDIKEMRWQDPDRWVGTRTTKFDCFNEYRQVSL